MEELAIARLIGSDYLAADEVVIAKAVAEEEFEGGLLMAKQKLSSFEKAMLETAEGMFRVGIMDEATYEKITLRHLGAEAFRVAQPISGEEIRGLRERANLSQGAFARFLNLSVGYVSQLERGTKKPSGAALTLLNVIRRKGFEAIL